MGKWGPRCIVFVLPDVAEIRRGLPRSLWWPRHWSIGAEAIASDKTIAIFDFHVFEHGKKRALSELSAFDNITILIFALYNVSKKRYF